MIELAAERRKLAFQTYVEHLSTPMLMPHSGTMANPAKSKFVKLLTDINNDAMQQSPAEVAWLQAAIEQNRKIWLWSDLHLNHENIIKYCSRPFSAVAEMNSALIAAAQQIPKDELSIIVGDFAMGRIAGVQLQWESIQPCRLIAGNHDQDVWGSTVKFPWADAIQVLFYKNKEYWVTHYPLRTEMIPADVMNIHGHIHDKLISNSSKHINVSVEITGYKPKLLSEVIDASPYTNAN